MSKEAILRRAEAAEDDWQLAEAKNARMEKALTAAEEAIKLTGHLRGCSFSACTCGATEQFKTARLEFFRLLHEARA
jgi:hypothetical protein